MAHPLARFACTSLLGQAFILLSDREDAVGKYATQRPWGRKPKQSQGVEYSLSSSPAQQEHSQYRRADRSAEQRPLLELPSGRPTPFDIAVAQDFRSF
jgi:hypothetical protein